MSEALLLLLDPTATLPKSRVDGLTASCPAASPLPERAMVVDPLEALLVMVNVPLAVPAVEGVKATVNVKL